VDRCPVDILAYLFTHAEVLAFDADDWIGARRRSADCRR
jgi:hypothetical protein